MDLPIFSPNCLEIKDAKVLKFSIQLAKLSSREFFTSFLLPASVYVWTHLLKFLVKLIKLLSLIVSILFLCGNSYCFCGLYSVWGTSIEAKLIVSSLDIAVFIFWINRYCSELLLTYLFFNKNFKKNMTFLFLYYDLENKGTTNMGACWCLALYIAVSNEFKRIWETFILFCYQIALEGRYCP